MDYSSRIKELEKGLGKKAKLFVELERDRDSDDNTYAAGFKLVF